LALNSVGRDKERKMSAPRGIAVIDAGKTNTKIVLFDGFGKALAERKVASRNHEGPPYRHLDPAPVMELCRKGLPELDAILPIDVIVPSAHGAAVACLNKQGALAMPVMDYTAEPPPEIVRAYRTVEPSFEETGSPLLPMALTHGLQLFWQQRTWPGDFAGTAAIVPWIQFVAVMLGGRPTTEVSSMSCQSHLMDVRNATLSSLVDRMGIAKLFPPMAKAWETIGTLNDAFKGNSFRGEGRILAGVHDSNANYLRYLAAGQKNFTLLSTGTWIIAFDTEAGLSALDRERDTVSNTDVFGNLVICARFFGGYEFDAVSRHAAGEAASVAGAQQLIDRGIMALPSFSDAGGPVPHSANKGRVIGDMSDTEEARASLASLYCAQMVSESLDALGSAHDIIVDGPFSRNLVFLGALADLRQGQRVMASDLRDGTTAGAACLGLMQDGRLPNIPLSLTEAKPARLKAIADYHGAWRKMAYAKS
jgi:sugar (pentulose or hexulose) kinase